MTMLKGEDSLELLRARLSPVREIEHLVLHGVGNPDIAVRAMPTCSPPFLPAVESRFPCQWDFTEIHYRSFR
jgi:hypothetical protein